MFLIVDSLAPFSLAYLKMAFQWRMSTSRQRTFAPISSGTHVFQFDLYWRILPSGSPASRISLIMACTAW